MSKIFCNKCSAVAEMGDHLATIDMGRKLAAFLEGLAGFPSNTMWPGLRPTSYQVACLSTQLLARIDIGRKVGELSPFGG